LSYLRSLRTVAAALVIATGALPALAGPFQEPTGEVILTIDGSLGADAPADGYALDLAALQNLPAEEFTTATIWTEGDIKFTGVPIRVLLDATGAKGDTVIAEALNGYSVEIPMSELEALVPIVAYRINGEVFSRRDKGPLWIVFPYDRDEKYKSEITYAFSIWQLHRLTVK
jgi:hypothetical protein